MKKSPFELHPDRLSTTDAEGHRLFVYPADVKGYFRTKRTQVQGVLLVLFLFLPWLKIDGKQALLLDFIGRKFEIFGLSLRAHNAPLLLLLLVTLAFGIFFITAVFGRVWCGWACPQTVFIDGVFRRIERWIEGPALERRKLNSEKMSSRKFGKKLAKWSLFLAATLVITHSFLAYFVGTDALRQMITQSPFDNFGSFLFMASLSGLLLYNFGWFREQFCTIACPYGRLQSVLMDKGSLVVAYDVQRGEPRSTPQAKSISQNHNSKLGDCVNCYRCVQVCPTGIDIRRGVQMECIACTACIDACDDVMTKIKKPVGLIKYDTLLPQKKLNKSRVGVRAYAYLSLASLSLVLLSISILQLEPISIEFLRGKDDLYTVHTKEDNSVIVTNHFKIELSNQSGKNQNLVFQVADGLLSEKIQIITAKIPLELADGKMNHADIFFRFPSDFLSNGQRKIRIKVLDQSQAFETEKEVTLVGPVS